LIPHRTTRAVKYGNNAGVLHGSTASTHSPRRPTWPASGQASCLLTLSGSESERAAQACLNPVHAKYKFFINHLHGVLNVIKK